MGFSITFFLFLSGLIVSPGYDIAHVYPQSKIAENVNSYLTSNSMPNLRFFNIFLIYKFKMSLKAV